MGLICFPFYRIAAAASGTLPLKDATGRTVLLTQPPKRIVVVGGAPFVPLHLLYMFPEMSQLLVGYERRVKTQELFLPLVDPDCRGKMVLEPNPGPEQIAALRPDLVVTKGNTTGYLARSLAVLDIPVLHLGVENPERFLKDIQTMGKALGNEKRSAEIVAFYRKRLDIIKQGLAAMSPQIKPSILVLEYSNRGGTTAVRVPARSWIQTIQVQTAGGRPVWLDFLSGQDGYQIVGFEQIAQWNPDKIFMIVWYRLNGKEVMRNLQADKKWRLLKAVSSKELYLFPQDIYGWDTPDPRWILGMLWMAKTIYPEPFVHIDMKEQIYAFFVDLFGMKKEIVERKIIPKVVMYANEQL